MATMNLEGLAAQFRVIKSEASGPAVLAAAEAVAEEGKAIVQTLLSHHGRGAPGGPPGLVTGELRASIRTTPAVLVGAGVAESSCSPHTVYAHIQEVGGPIWPNGGYLHWVDSHGSAYAKRVTIRSHPYMQIMREEGEASGAFREAARAAFNAVTGL
jgi:hypothetical protein